MRGLMTRTGSAARGQPQVSSSCGKEGYARGVSMFLMICVVVISAVSLLGAGMLIEAGMFDCTA